MNCGGSFITNLALHNCLPVCFNPRPHSADDTAPIPAVLRPGTFGPRHSIGKSAPRQQESVVRPHISAPFARTERFQAGFTPAPTDNTRRSHIIKADSHKPGTRVSRDVQTTYVTSPPLVPRPAPTRGLCGPRAGRPCAHPAILADAEIGLRPKASMGIPCLPGEREDRETPNSKKTVGRRLPRTANGEPAIGNPQPLLCSMSRPAEPPLRRIRKRTVRLPLPPPRAETVAVPSVAQPVGSSG